MIATRKFKRKMNISYARYLKGRQVDRYVKDDELSSAEKHTERVRVLKKSILRMVILLVILLIIWPLANRHWGSNLSFTNQKESAQSKNAENRPVMLKPKFYGNDDNGKPYSLNAISGVSVNDDKIVLNELSGDMELKDNSKVKVASKHGNYSSKAKTLILNDGVIINMDNGYEFTTNSAYVKLDENTANGSEEVLIKGPLGDINAKGFVILNSGDEIVLSGGVDLKAAIPDEDIKKMNDKTEKEKYENKKPAD